MKFNCCIATKQLEFERAGTAPFGDGEVKKRCMNAKRKWIRKHLGTKWISDEKFICVKVVCQILHVMSCT